MSAIRLARGATGRNKIVKCIGCYHGHADSLLVSAGSGATTLGVPSSPGVPAEFTAHTLAVPYNGLPAMEEAFAACGKDIAAVLVEPVAGNMGVIGAGGRLSPGPAAAMRPLRGIADLRRGDDRLPPGLRRCTRALRRRART